MGTGSGGGGWVGGGGENNRIPHNEYLTTLAKGEI